MNNAIFLNKLTDREAQLLKKELRKQGFQFDILKAHNIVLQNRDDIEDTLLEEIEQLLPKLPRDIHIAFRDNFYMAGYIDERMGQLRHVVITTPDHTTTDLYWFFPIEHDMEDAGDNEHSIPFCTICGYPNTVKQESEEPF